MRPLHPLARHTSITLLTLALITPLWAGHPIKTTPENRPETPVEMDATPSVDPADNAKPLPPAPEVHTSVDRNAVIIRQAKVYRGPSFTVGEIPAPASATPAASPTSSHISVSLPEPRKYKKHDIITIIVREDSDASTSGKGDSNKKQDLDFSLDQFLNVNLAKLQVSSTANPSSLPKVKFSFKNDRSNDASQQRTDKASARISATIVDVKPNGTLVIEATKHITLDKEEQDFKLSGICRADDITIDNTLLSTQLANLQFKKTTTGEVRDGVKRGWLNKFIDAVNPF